MLRLSRTTRRETEIPLDQRKRQRNGRIGTKPLTSGSLLMKSWAFASFAALIISSSVMLSFPYRIFSRIVVSKSTGSWPTTPMCERSHWTFNFATSTPSSKTCSNREIDAWSLWELSLTLTNRGTGPRRCEAKRKIRAIVQRRRRPFSSDGRILGESSFYRLRRNNAMENVSGREKEFKSQLENIMPNIRRNIFGRRNCDGCRNTRKFYYWENSAAARNASNLFPKIPIAAFANTDVIMEYIHGRDIVNSERT